MLLVLEPESNSVRVFLAVPENSAELPALTRRISWVHLKIYDCMAAREMEEG